MAGLKRAWEAAWRRTAPPAARRKVRWRMVVWFALFAVCGGRLLQMAGADIMTLRVGAAFWLFVGCGILWTRI